MKQPSGAAGATTAAVASSSIASALGLQGGSAAGIPQISGVVQAVGMLGYVSVPILPDAYHETAPNVHLFTSASIAVGRASKTNADGCIARWDEHSPAEAIVSAEGTLVTALSIVGFANVLLVLAHLYARRKHKLPTADATASSSPGPAEATPPPLLLPPPSNDLPRILRYPTRILFVVDTLFAPRMTQSFGFVVGACLKEPSAKAAMIALALGIVALGRPAYIAWVLHKLARRATGASYVEVSAGGKEERLNAVLAQRDSPFNKGALLRYMQAQTLGHAGCWQDTSEFVNRHGAAFEGFQHHGLAPIQPDRAWRTAVSRNGVADAPPPPTSPREDESPRTTPIMTHPAFVHAAVDTASFLLLGVFAVPCACTSMTFACTHLQLLLLVACVITRCSTTLMSFGRAMASGDACIELATDALWATVIIWLWLWAFTQTQFIPMTAACMQYPLLLVPTFGILRGLYANLSARKALWLALRTRNDNLRRRRCSTYRGVSFDELVLHSARIVQSRSTQVAGGLADAGAGDESAVALGDSQWQCAGPSNASHAVPAAASPVSTKGCIVTSNPIFTASVDASAAAEPIPEYLIAFARKAPSTSTLSNESIVDARSNLTSFSSERGALTNFMAGFFARRLRGVRGRLNHVHRPSIHGPFDPSDDGQQGL